MMLPEHVAEINRHRKELEKKTLPQLDDQELEELSRRIGEAKKQDVAITLTVWGEYEDRDISGIVRKVMDGEVQLRTIYGLETVSYLHIMNANRLGETCTDD
jgi:hypothetical protein